MIRPNQGAEAPTHPHTPPLNWPDLTAQALVGGAEGRGLGWKIDTRGWGGYVVAPSGSITPHGRYQVIRDVPPAELPGWLLERLAARPSPTISAPREIATERLPSYVAAALAGMPGQGKSPAVRHLVLGLVPADQEAGGGHD